MKKKIITLLALITLPNVSYGQNFMQQFEDLLSIKRNYPHSLTTRMPRKERSKENLTVLTYSDKRRKGLISYSPTTVLYPNPLNTTTRSRIGHKTTKEKEDTQTRN
jgi:hypothetical protein